MAAGRQDCEQAYTATSILTLLLQCSAAGLQAASIYRGRGGRSVAVVVVVAVSDVVAVSVERRVNSRIVSLDLISP